MKIQQKQVINVQDWDNAVQDTYKRPYNFQQQAGCRGRENFYLTVPAEPEDFENDTLPEKVNHEEMGVSFKAWLARDPKQPLKDETEDTFNSQTQTYRKEWAGGEQWRIDLWWERNFYPDIQMVANDLYNKGVLPAGEYMIVIDW